MTCSCRSSGATAKPRWSDDSLLCETGSQTHSRAEPIDPRADTGNAETPRHASRRRGRWQEPETKDHPKQNRDEHADECQGGEHARSLERLQTPCQPTKVLGQQLTTYRFVGNPSKVPWHLSGRFGTS